MSRHLLLAMTLLGGIALTACDENQPVNTGPTVHCFNESTGQTESVPLSAKVTYKQDVNTGKVQVTCPTGQ